ncbi:MAG TPA: DUF2922 domain-containing protein [Clostridium sp.]|nr:DUF2922 domain-containing protein [Clostridium sp.]
MEYILTMTFITSTNAKSTMSINGVKPDLTKDQISSLMDAIIEKNIFETKSGTLTGKAGANITERKVTKYDLA